MKRNNRIGIVVMGITTLFLINVLPLNNEVSAAPVSWMYDANLTDFTDWPWEIAWSPEDDYLATAGKDGYLNIYKTSDWSLDDRILITAVTPGSPPVAWSEDGKHIVTAKNSPSQPNLDTTVIIDTSSTPWVISEFVLTPASDGILSYHFTPDSDQLIIKTDKSVIKYHVGSWAAPIDVFDYDITHGELSFSPDYRFFSHQDWTKGCIFVREVSDGSLVTKLEGLGYRPHAASFTSDGEYIICGSDAGNVMIWTTSDWNLVTSFNLGNQVRDIRCHNDPDYLSMSLRTFGIRLYDISDINNWELVVDDDPHGGLYGRIEWSHSGAELATIEYAYGGGANSIRVYNFDCNNDGKADFDDTTEGWIIERIDPGIQSSTITSIALDSNGNPCVAYWDKDLQQLKYARKINGIWNRETVWSPGVVISGISLILDEDDNPYISCTDDSHSHPYYHYKTETGWVNILLDPGRTVGDETSIGLDSNNNPHISYSDQNNVKLVYANYSNDQWTIQEIDSNGGGGSSLKMDDNDFPYISYGSYPSGDLRYIYKNDNGWISPISVDTEGYTGLATSLDLDSNGYPHISYRDNTKHEMKYAHFDGISWSYETVEIDANYTWTSIALDDDDIPHICYYNANGDLKLAYYNNGWIKEIINHGQGTSFQYGMDIAIRENTLVVSFIDPIDLEVKIAYKSNEVENEKTWTLMIYMDADNDLSTAEYWFNRDNEAKLDFMEMTNVDVIDYTNVNVICLKDEYGDNPENTNLYYIDEDGATTLNTTWLDSEENMGLQSTLSDFVGWCLEEYPADYTFLVMWGHGQYWKGFGNDVSSDNDSLELIELKSALSNSLGEEKLDIIGFDSCFMGNIETMYQLKDFADIFIGSEKTGENNEIYAIGDGTSWIFNKIINYLNDELPPDEVAYLVVNDNIDNISSELRNNRAHTWSAIELQYIDSLKLIINSLSNNLIKYYYNNYSKILDARLLSQEFIDNNEKGKLVDLYDFCDHLYSNSDIEYWIRVNAHDAMREIQRCVINNRYYSTENYDVDDSHGISIFFPKYLDTYETELHEYHEGEEIDFSSETQWDEFLLLMFGYDVEQLSNRVIEIKNNISNEEGLRNSQKNTLFFFINIYQNRIVKYIELINDNNPFNDWRGMLNLMGAVASLMIIDNLITIHVNRDRISQEDGVQYHDKLNLIIEMYTNLF